MITRERIQEDIDALGPDGFRTETVKVTKRRLRHLRRVEQLAIDFNDRLLDADGLRRALTDELQERGDRHGASERA